TVTDGRETRSIVCGADNMKAGDLVALAPVGVQLPRTPKFPEGITLKRAKIRGETSEGMMCSEEELGLAEHSDGILILPPGLALGTPLPEALGLADTAIEIELTPNRGDCLGIRGIARELSALLGRPLKTPAHEPEEKGPAVDTLAQVEVRAPELCPRYTARVVRGVRVGDSPAWLQARLQSVGLRPVNNVVDVTNYVMWELGQPLHAFDLARLEGRRIIVRSAAEGEPLALLDGTSHTLAARDLVIADAARPVALAGVMGGADSEISPDTTDLLIESAGFHPSTVRKSARALGVHSDSSHRFERGVDLDAVPEALDMAAALILRVAGGEVARGRIDIAAPRSAPPPIVLRAARVTALLGIEISEGEIARILTDLGVALEATGPGLWRAAAPSWRTDLTREADLIEEVARVWGYDRIAPVLPRGALSAEAPLPMIDRLDRDVRRVLTGIGIYEAVNLGFQSTALWERMGVAPDHPLRRMIEIRNPMVQDERFLRTSLLPALAANLATNERYGTRTARLFELGRAVFKEGEGRKREVPSLGILLAGGVRERRWMEPEVPADFHGIRGVVESLIGRLVPDARLSIERGETSPLLHPSRAARVLVRGAHVGDLGELHPDVVAALDLTGVPWAAELDVEALAAAAAERRRSFEELPKFPAITRDVTIQIDRSTEAATAVRAIADQGVRLLVEVVVLDLYEGPPVPAGKRALTLRLVYQDSKKTLTDAKINATHEKIVERLLQRVGGSLGSSG
ncbi:MAG: phenylalanine--tRNA ligase subunit beta, partial [Myxococcales bacterium]|nr:phenylalanine--tRNA ligase subunit beta [Myxococcales bacterium]